MNLISFKYNDHPGDFFRNTDVIALPNPYLDLDSFLVQFLKSYASDERVSFVDDLNKLLHDEFFNDEDKLEFIKITENLTDKEIATKIQEIENELINEAYSNFYKLVLNKHIEILAHVEK